MLVEAKNVTKSYGDSTAVDGVSLSVGEGEVFALVGPNGAGKTTLIKCLSGVFQPDSGEAEIEGVDCRSFDRDRLGVLPQEFTPPERLSVAELVEYYGSLYSNCTEVETVVRQLGLEDSLDTRYRNLSGGQKRRLCVAAAVVNDPDVLFLDEPTTGIDPAGRRELWRYIRELKSQGTCIFLTTHYMEEAEALADRVGLLSNGELVEVGEPDTLIEKHAPEPELLLEHSGDLDTGELVEALSREFDADIPETEVKFEPDTKASFTVAGEHVVFQGVETHEIGEILDRVNSSGVSYSEAVWRQPGLREVYVKLVDNNDAESRGFDEVSRISGEVSADGGDGA